MIKYTYNNEYQVFILPKHTPASLYLPSFNKIVYQSHLDEPFCHVTDACMLNKEVNLSHEILFPCYSIG